MKLRLIHKLLIALFASTALVLALIVVMTRFSFGRGFEEFLHRQELARVEPVVSGLAARYVDDGGWEQLSAAPRALNDMVRETLGGFYVGRGFGGERLGPRWRREALPPDAPAEDPAEPVPGQRSGRGERFGQPPGAGRGLHQRVFLLDANRQPVVGEALPDIDKLAMLPVEVSGEVVGWLGVHPMHREFAPEEQAFMQHQRNALLAGLGGSLFMAAVLAWLLARHLGRPVSAAARGLHALAAGDFESRVETRGEDEIAALGRDVNRLAQVLAEHESARQRWIADIAHELRTPLSIILGELEAMTDGVRPVNADNLASVSEEVRHFSRLVDDLHSLALSDSGALAYKMESLDFRELVELAVEGGRALAADKALEIRWSQPPQRMPVEGDETRLRQLLRNLLENAVRYTDEPGRIEVTLEARDRQAVLRVSDSEPGIPEKQCARIFERFHRIEGSRNRNSGGSGLGLAICRNIVEAHGGTIEAGPGPLGGLALTVTLPMES